MNYITEINSFYDWLETNSISKSAISLWHALMHINNKANWIREFSVAISVLEFKTGFKRSELFEARKILVNKGRLKWEQRGGNLSAIYQLIPFCIHSTDTNTNSDLEDRDCIHNTDANTYSNPIQKHTINKLNNTERKQENIDIEKITYPFSSKKFLKAIEELYQVNYPFASKSIKEQQIDLNGLKAFDEDFSIMLIQNAIEKNLDTIIYDLEDAINTFECLKAKQVSENNQKSKVVNKLNLNFVSDDFKEAFSEWVDYRNQIKKPLKSEKTLQINYDKLVSLSEGNNENAKKIVRQSIERGWTGLFAIHEPKKANYTHPIAQFNNPQKLANDDRW